MSLSFLRICPCLFALFFGSVAAQDNELALRQMALDPSWLRLGHYEPDTTTTSGWRSAIQSGYFLDENGRHDPFAELKATLAAFSAAPAHDPDQHVRCRFPARTHWLETKLGTLPGMPPPNCPQYEKWTRSGSVTSVSIIFATGYLGNPASYYGHTLLKFNFEGDKTQTRLMDESVNFGAILEKQDDPVTYLFKSVTGGYDAGFSHHSFYFHNHNYGDNELRDMWEYKLDLPREAVNQIVAHAWEVLGKRYRYDFFRHNCAYRMAELLEVVDGVKVIPENSPWIIPQALIQQLAAANYQGNRLVKDVTFLPSRQSRFYRRYSDLANQDARLLRKVVLGNEVLGGEAFQSRPIRVRQGILDAMVDYYQFANNPLEKAPLKVKQKYKNVLSERYRLPPGLSEVTDEEPLPPHLSRPLGWAQLAWRHNTRKGNELLATIRPAYYDALDSDSSHVQNSKLVMGEFQVAVGNDQVYIDRIDIIGVDSTKPGLTGLPGDTGIAWKLHTGAEQARLSCEDCLVGRVQGDVGYGHQFFNGLFGAVYFGGALQSYWKNQGIGFGRASVDFIYRSPGNFGARLSHEQRLPARSRLGSYGMTSAELRWSIDQRSDVRLRYELDKVEQVTLGVGMYW